MEGTSSTRRGRAAIACAVTIAALSGGLLACGSSPTRSAAPGAAGELVVEPRLPDAPATTAGRAAGTSSTDAVTIATDAAIAVETTTTVPATVPPVDVDDPAIAGRPLPPPAEAAPPPSPSAVSPWASFTSTAPNGKVATDVGCAGTDAASIDTFFADRVGPVMGWDYQHVYPLGGDRYLWLFQDAFIDRTGTAAGLGSAGFVHNAALVQTGKCFSLQHGGTAEVPLPFEVGDGKGTERATWYWPLGGEVSGNRLWIFWAKMQKDGYDPLPPDGLGWHPVGTYLASYDRTTLTRLSFAPAPNAGASPLYGYSVASDGTYSYLFGNTFEQNLVRDGGYANAPHSATNTWLARVPQGQLWGAPEYRTADGWSPDPAAAVPIRSRFAVEDPVQPRFIAGRWVSVSKVDGYWGDDLVVDTALDPWGPWTTAERFRLVPRAGDPARNTYHAHLLPWLDRGGNLLVSVSGNARNMLRDAWPHPERYRPMVFARAMPPLPPMPAPTVPPTSEPPVTDPSVGETTTSTADTTSVASEPATVTTPVPTSTSAPSTSAPSTTASSTSAPSTTAPATTEPSTTLGSASTTTTSTPTAHTEPSVTDAPPPSG